MSLRWTRKLLLHVLGLLLLLLHMLVHHVRRNLKPVASIQAHHARVLLHVHIQRGRPTRVDDISRLVRLPC